LDEVQNAWAAAEVEAPRPMTMIPQTLLSAIVVGVIALI
jgi:hypothetical protein